MQWVARVIMKKVLATNKIMIVIGKFC